MTRISKTALLEHIGWQLDFLRASAERYESGRKHEALRIAAVIRILCFDADGARRNRSRSLLVLPEGADRGSAGGKNASTYAADHAGALVTSFDLLLTQCAGCRHFGLAALRVGAGARRWACPTACPTSTLKSRCGLADAGRPDQQHTGGGVEVAAGGEVGDARRETRACPVDLEGRGGIDRAWAYPS